MAVRCNDVAPAWPIRGGTNDRFEEKEEGDDEANGGGVVWKMREEEDGQDCHGGGEELPEADFGVAGHPWLV